MSTLLLDASVVLAAFDREDRHHEEARALLGDNGVTLTTLDLARYEVANVAICGWKAPEVVSPLLGALEQIGGDGGVLPSTAALIGRAAEIAQLHGISVYDATYVAATAEGNRRLVSCDARDLVSKGLAVTPGAAG